MPHPEDNPTTLRQEAMTQLTPDQPTVPTPPAAPAEPADATAAGRGSLLVVLGIIALLAVALTAILTHGFRTDKGDAKRACEASVTDQLKSPATAKFSGEIVTEDSGSYRVTGHVDSENGFGAMLRSHYSCTAHSSGGEWVTDDVSVI